MTDPRSDLAPEDVKLVTLARAARARTCAAEGACLRDLDGRTYAGATVDLPSLQLSAVAVAVTSAAVGGAVGLEAAVVLTAAETVTQDDLDLVRQFGGERVTVFRADTSGRITQQLGWSDR